MRVVNEKKVTREEIYERLLVAYKKERKHTMVSAKYKEDPQLGGWVHNQRNAYKKKMITVERKRVFNSICFARKICPS